MSDKLLSAAVRVHSSLNNALTMKDMPSEEIMKLSAIAINILLYDRIKQWVRENDLESDKKKEEEPIDS